MSAARSADVTDAVTMILTHAAFSDPVESRACLTYSFCDLSKPDLFDPTGIPVESSTTSPSKSRTFGGRKRIKVTNPNSLVLRCSGLHELNFVLNSWVRLANSRLTGTVLASFTELERTSPQIWPLSSRSLECLPPMPPPGRNR